MGNEVVYMTNIAKIKQLAKNRNQGKGNSVFHDQLQGHTKS